MADVGCAEEQSIYTDLTNHPKLAEMVDVLLEKPTAEWWPLLSKLCFVDFMAVLAIVCRFSFSIIQKPRYFITLNNMHPVSILK